MLQTAHPLVIMSPKVQTWTISWWISEFLEVDLKILDGSGRATLTTCTFYLLAGHNGFKRSPHVSSLFLFHSRWIFVTCDMCDLVGCNTPSHERVSSGVNWFRHFTNQEKAEQQGRRTTRTRSFIRGRNTWPFITRCWEWTTPELFSWSPNGKT